MKIEIWSDISCPWCWLGKHNLEQAIRESGVPRAEFDVHHRSFELAPDAGAPVLAREFLAKRHGGLEAVEAAQARLKAIGAEAGIHYDFERALIVNTFDAHRLTHLAKARGLGGPVLERLMRAHHGEGADISDRATLRALAIETGLDAREVDATLASDAYAADVRADERAASGKVTGVPFFVFDGRLALSGARSIEEFLDAIATARKAAAPGAAGT